MKCFRIFVIVSLCYLSCSDKEILIDSLVNRINNKQIVMTHQLFSLPQMKSPAADSLIQIGKPATEKLIAVLDDINKGIVAHYILSFIWYDEWKIKPWPDSLQTHNSQDEGKGMLSIINGLKYYYNDELGSYAEKEELERNKIEWQKFTKSMNTNQSIHH